MFSVQRGGALAVPQIYTAEELSVAIHDLMLHLVTADDDEAMVYAKVMAAIAGGEIVALGILNGKIAFGLPEAAGWLDKVSQ